MQDMHGRRIDRVFPAFPVAIVVVGEGERSNPVTLAMVHVFSFEPTLIGIGLSPKRHSYGLLKDLPEFVIALPRFAQAKETLDTGSTSGRDGNKWKVVNLTPVPSKVVRPPSVKECPVNLECRVVQEFETGDHVWFVGEVVANRVDDGYAPDEALLYWGGKFRKPGDVVLLRR
jgi:flavin reductase (DIM6/NTAB) family NADH-FMN oxidoreductase RutF